MKKKSPHFRVRSCLNPNTKKLRTIYRQKKLQILSFLPVTRHSHVWVALSASKQLFTEQGGNKLGKSPDAFALLGSSGLFQFLGRSLRTLRLLLRPLDKQEFISADLYARSLLWAFTNECPPPIPRDTNAFRFAGFGSNEIVVYYDFIRFLLSECFERKITNPEIDTISEINKLIPAGEISIIHWKFSLLSVFF